MSKKNKKKRKPNRRTTAASESRTAAPECVSPLRRSFESSDGYFIGQSLIDRCGTIDAVESLTDEVLPFYPVDWSVVPEADREVVETVLDLVDRVCVVHLDAEYRSVSQRLVLLAASHPAFPLRSRTSPDRLAAAILWIALVANMDRLILRSYGPDIVWSWFGVTPCTRMARKIATTLGFRPEPEYGEPVGWDRDKGVYVRDAGLLTSQCRRELIDRRERLNEMLVEQEERKRLARPMVHNGDGQVRTRLVETDFALSVRTSLDAGRQVIALGLGGSKVDPDYVFALSIPEARRLINGVQRALDSNPLPVRFD